MLRLLKPVTAQFRIINLAIESEYADSLEYLANAMDLMPNLHTIQIICEGYHIQRRCVRRRVIDTDQFLKAFRRHTYPSVKRAILPVQARGMLASLPAVADVYINAIYSDHFSEFVGALAANCPVESLGWQVGHDASAAGTRMIFIAVSISYKVQW